MVTATKLVTETAPAARAAAMRKRRTLSSYHGAQKLSQ